MPPLVLDKPESLKDYAGKEVAVTGWMPVEQERISRFADVTDDRQWIHVEPERAAKESPYGATVAHGFLTLSLLSRFLMQSIRVEDIRMGVNYGLNKVRFPAPVTAGSKIRARFTLQSVEDIKGGLQTVWDVVIECEGSEKPCCVAEWLIRYYT